MNGKPATKIRVGRLKKESEERNVVYKPVYLKSCVRMKRRGIIHLEEETVSIYMCNQQKRQTHPVGGSIVRNKKEKKARLNTTNRDSIHSFTMGGPRGAGGHMKNTFPVQELNTKADVNREKENNSLMDMGEWCYSLHLLHL